MDVAEYTMKTPSYSHVTAAEFDHVYEPSEDTFLLIDALEKDLGMIMSLNPKISLEVGSGTGLVITALGMVLGQQCHYIATDINLRACNITAKTGISNGVSVETVCTDLVESIADHMLGQVDILLFNPPYVPTPAEEVGKGNLEYTWAGGKLGREVMDRLFPFVPKLLSNNGLFYLLVMQDNKPEEVIDIMKTFGLNCAKILSRKVRNEHLSVLRFRKHLME